MISLSNTLTIAVPPEKVWQFLSDLDRQYTHWHPEHLRWRTLNGAPLAPGTVWFADEWVGPMRISSRFFVVDSRPGEFFTYRVGFPSSLGRAGGSFRLTRTWDGGCVVTEEVHFGFSAPILGRLLDKVLEWVLPIEEICRHIREEGEGLVRILAPTE